MRQAHAALHSARFPSLPLGTALLALLTGSGCAGLGSPLAQHRPRYSPESELPTPAAEMADRRRDFAVAREPSVSEFEASRSLTKTVTIRDGNIQLPRTSGKTLTGTQTGNGKAETLALPGWMFSNNDQFIRYRPDQVVRGQSPMYRGQSLDEFGQPMPQDMMQGGSPQGNPYGALGMPPAAQTPGYVDLDIDVSEGRTGRLMFGVGVNSNSGIVGSLVLQEDNFDLWRPPQTWADIVNGQAFRGGGQSFRMEAMPSLGSAITGAQSVSRYLISWQDPYFLNSDFSLGLSGFYWNRLYQEWQEDRTGGRISLGYILNKYWTMGAAYRLESVDMHGFGAAAPASLKAVAGSNLLQTGSLTTTYDTRDSAFLPTRGHTLEGTFEQAFGEFSYSHFEVSGSQHFTVYQRPDGFGKHLVNLHAQSAWTGDGTPIFERFYAGGYNSFRGYRFRGVTPREGAFHTGGNFMFLGTAEYMLPVTADDNIRVVAFSDFGTVDTTTTFQHFRATAGVGLRLAIPAMGPAPIALDFAWPVFEKSQGDRQVFSFYMGFVR